MLTNKISVVECGYRIRLYITGFMYSVEKLMLFILNYQQENISKMNKLPDEILLMIFDYLPPRILYSIVSKVCRRWKNMVSHRVITMTNYSKILNMNKGVVAVFAPLDQISIQIQLPIEIAIKLHTMNIRELILNDNFPIGEIFMKSLHSIKTLRHLDVFALSDLHTGYLPPPQVNSIVLNNNIRPDYLINLAPYKQIKALHMYGQSHNYILSKMRLVIRLHSKHLTHLTLICHGIKDRRWKVIGQCTNLLQLHMYTCSSVTAKGVVHVMRLPKLKVLHITGCTILRPTALARGIRQLSHSLVELNLSATPFSELHIPVLVTTVPRLRRLELWSCGLTPEGVLQLAAGLAQLVDLDTDVTLSRDHLARLAEHPALKELRCVYKEPSRSCGCAR
ncbi:uncharacterized protein LOC119835089 isoform X2 [Zerene cesonia]|uniref:uncharacterized protein LOC119835089 isoform X2 n=1 Tax=Zerene cesonia TaxID=33412 RepID=UPI0018E58D8A|nr:uncharacterized protein LOC119835089 isoform X2 [Zerene cesonia]